MKIERLQLEDLRKEYQVVVVAALVDWDTSTNSIKDTLEQAKSEFKDKSVCLGWTTDDDFTKELRVGTFPCYIIYHRGQAVEKSVGPMDYDTLVSRVNQYL